MICIYCQNKLEDTYDSGYFECRNHNKIEVNFLLGGNIKKYKIWYTTFHIKKDDNKYGITLCHIDGVCKINKYDTGNNPREICRFNYVPEVTPDTAQYKLNTILTFL